MGTGTSISVLAILAAAGTLAHAQPVNPPVYSTVLEDASSADNAFNAGGFRYYTIDGGADSYQNDIYERPTAAAFQVITLPDGSERYAAEEYFSYVDIVRAKLGYDAQFLYASIKVAGLTTNTKDGVNNFDGLIGGYTVRFGPDPDGRNSIALRANAPENSTLPSLFSRNRTEGYRDTDGDVGGRGGPVHGNGGPSGISVTRTQNVLEEQGLNGYDQQFITSDGRLESGSQIVLWQRIDPTDPTTVEIAFDYVTAGLTQADLQAIRYLHFDAVKGNPTGPVEALWNDKYFAIDAGSPNRGIGTDNEFGTQGLGSINGVDSVRLIGCAADFNADTVIDFFDYLDFVAAFSSNAANSDFNGDTVIDFFDYLDFVAAFSSGC